MSITYAAYDNVLRDDTGRAIVNAEIYVYRADTGTLAQLYDLAGNPVGQPLSTDQHGGIDNGSTHSAEARQGFRAPGGRYLIRSFKNGVEGRRIPEVMIGGAIVEQGENANGSYWRWESGLQVCTHTLTLQDALGDNLLAGTWVYPAGFTSFPYVNHSLRQGLKSDATPPLWQRFGKATAGHGLASVSLRAVATGDVDWAAGDVMTTDAFAIGRWK